MRWVGVGVLLGSSFLWAGSAPKRPPSLVITNVNVVDTRYGGVHPNMAVAIKDGVIVAVTKFALVEAGPQLQVINGNGGYLLPGLWDMKAHVKGLPAESQKTLFDFYIASGITGVRDMDTDEVQVLPDAGDMQPEVEPARPLWLQRTSATEARGGWGHTIEDLSQIVAICCSPTTAGQSTPEDREQRGSDQTATEFSSEIARRTFMEISDHGTWVVPGLIAEKRTDALSAKEPPAQGMIPGQFSDETASPSPGQLSRDIELVRNMHRVGVQFLTGTGVQAANTRSAGIAEELELLVRSGLSPLEALQSATINPALCMAKLNKYGVVESGHIADLVLLRGNPLRDIHNARNVTAVVLRGRYLARAELDAMLANAESGIRGPENAAAVRGAAEH